MNPGLQRLFATAILCLTLSVPAATLTITTSAPTPGTNDIYNFTGAPHDGANVGDGGSYADGSANDAFTYVAGDRADRDRPLPLAATPTAICQRRLGAARGLHQQYRAHLVGR